MNATNLSLQIKELKEKKKQAEADIRHYEKEIKTLEASMVLFKKGGSQHLLSKPEPVKQAEGARKYPFKKMAVGDWFVFSSNLNDYLTANSTCKACEKALKRKYPETQITFVARKEEARVIIVRTR